MHKKFYSFFLVALFLMLNSCGKGEVANPYDDDKWIDSLQTLKYAFEDDQIDSIALSMRDTSSGLSSTANGSSTGASSSSSGSGTIALSGTSLIGESSSVIASSSAVSSTGTSSSSLQSSSTPSSSAPSSSSAQSSSSVDLGPEYLINLTRGTASAGPYYAGVSVTITASSIPAGQCFTTWSGASIAVLADATANPATFNMPAADVTLTAETAVCTSACASSTIWKSGLNISDGDKYISAVDGDLYECKGGAYSAYCGTNGPPNVTNYGQGGPLWGLIESCP